MLAEFSIIPLGKDESVSGFVAKAVEIVHQSGLTYRVNPMGTVIEGNWDEVLDIIRKCHDEIKKEARRVITNITIDDRETSEPRIDKKIKSLEYKLRHKLKT
ncbi:MAG: MTH1187 family thiamine-binding protein [bacterium]